MFPSPEFLEIAYPCRAKKKWQTRRRAAPFVRVGSVAPVGVRRGVALGTVLCNVRLFEVQSNFHVSQGFLQLNGTTPSILRSSVTVRGGEAAKAQRTPRSAELRTRRCPPPTLAASLVDLTSGRLCSSRSDGIISPVPRKSEVMRAPERKVPKRTARLFSGETLCGSNLKRSK